MRGDEFDDTVAVHAECYSINRRDPGSTLRRASDGENRFVDEETNGANCRLKNFLQA